MRSSLRRAAVLLVLLGGCSEKAIETPPPPPKEEVDLVKPVADGQARAGRVSKVEELVGGPNAKGKKGDFKLANSKVRFIIEDAVPSSGYGPYGGGVLAADRARAAGEADQSYFGELITAFDLRAVKALTAEVIKDGIGGGPAQVRVTATDAVFPLLEAALSGASRDLGADIVIDYILEPDAEALKIVTTAKSRAGTGLDISAAQLGIMAGDGISSCQDGTGFGDEESGPLKYYGMAADPTSAVSYGYFAPGYPMELQLTYTGLALATLGKLQVTGSNEGKITLYLAVGNGDTASLLRIQETLGKATKPAPRLTVTATAGGKPVAGARVHITQGDEYRGFGISDAAGLVAFPLPPGDYSAEALTTSRDSLGKVAVTLTDAGAAVEAKMTEQGTLVLTVTEGGAPLPAKAILFRESPAAVSYPKSYGETRPDASNREIYFLPPEGAKLPLTVGKYRVVVQRGFEYDLAEQIADITPGAEVPMALKLIRLVDTTGWLSGDFHIHAAPSPDSSDPLSYKALSFGAEGLEVPISTDHEFITDYAPVVTALGLNRFVRSIIGEEVSTIPFGHFNAYPLLPLELPNNGAIDWYAKPAAQLFEEMRRNPGGPLVQVNHPRSGIAKGYFSMIGFNPDTFTAENQAQFVPNFDAMEVLNGTGVGESESQVQKDWFAFLKRGRHVTGTGNSDSHQARHNEVGTPRNYVFVGSDEPSAVDLKAFVKGVRDANVTVSEGPFVTMTLNGKPLGSTAPLAAGKAVLHVKLQAPPWMGPIEKLEILKDGVVVDTRTLTTFDKVLRYEGDYEDVPARDAFYLVRVRSAGGNLGPGAAGKRPYAFTNPIFVDVDGNGLYDPSL